jgi:hypothetical protein
MTPYLALSFVCTFVAGFMLCHLMQPRPQRTRPDPRLMPPPNPAPPSKHVDLLIEMQLPRGTECRECLAGKVADK